MEILIGLIVIAALGYLLYINNSKKPFDVNKDGKVGFDDAAAIVPVLAQKLDVNKDGKIDVKDVKVVASKVRPKSTTKAKANTVKPKTVAKKTAPKKIKK
jgi:hypothetical protein